MKKSLRNGLTQAKRGIKRGLPWFLGGLGLSLAVLLLWYAPNWDAADSVSDPKEKEELTNASWDTALRVLQTLGGLGFFATAYLAWNNLQLARKSYEIAEDRQVSERFGQAVTMLSNREELETRLGGIYLLERIAKDSQEDHPVVMEVLTAFIRDKSVSYASQEVSENEPPPRLCQDIQSALTVIGRRETEYDAGRPDLSGANLSRADLRGADLRGANLSRADLSNADLFDAKLTGVKLTGALLSGALLSGDNLSFANLSNADLRGANLSNADLFDAKLTGANLSGALLGHAHLSFANLSSADLSNTNLRGAGLGFANLSSADLHEADLEDIKFNADTQWPSLEALKHARNVPEVAEVFLNALSRKEEPEPPETENTDASAPKEGDSD